MKPTINSFIRKSQRLSLLTSLVTLTFSSVHSDAVELLKYQMGQLGPQVQDPINGAAGGNLTKGTGLNTFNINAIHAYPAPAVLTLDFLTVASPTLGAAITNNAYFTFTLTAGAGTTDIDLSSITFNAARGGGSAPRGYALYVTPPGGAEVPVQAATDLATVRSVWSPQNINLSGISSLQNLSAGQVVTFKIYAYSPATGSAIDFDDIIVNGEGGAVVVVDPAGTRTKANNSDDLNLLSSWATGLPTTGDVTQWNDVVPGANSTVLGADLSWQGIRIVNPGGPVTIGGANTLTLGASGIAMATATQNLTINSNLTIGTGIQTWNVPTLRTLTLGTGTFTRPLGTTLSLPGVGTVSSTMTNLSANTAGIVGAWATTGTGAATRYGTFSGGSIVALTGTTAADASALTDTTGAENYELADAGGTTQADVSANTIRYAGAAGTTSTGGTNFEVNGLMNVGSGTWTLDTNPLTIGAAEELVVNTAVSGIAISSVIQEPLGVPSALTKVGPGVLTLSGLNNAYTGPTTINSGVVDVGTIDNGSLGAGGLYFSGTDAVLQGNGTFTRNFSGLTTAADGEITGFTGGFAAKDAPLTVNFGGSSDTISLSGVSPKFGRNFIFGSSTSNDKVTVENPINLNGAQRLFTVNAGLTGSSAELAGTLSGTTPSGVNKLGAGRLLISAANTYTGATTVGAGILEISDPTALGTAALGGTNTTTVTTGASLQVTGGISTDPAETLTINGTGSTNVGALQAGTGGATWAGPLVLGGAAARVGAIADETLTITGTISGASGNGLAISGGAGTGVVVINPDTTNTYPGQTTIVRGILRLGKTNALPVTTILDAKDPANSTDAAVFDLAGFDQTLAGLLDSGTNNNDVVTNSVADTTSTLTLNNGTAQTFDGTIENGVGTMALVKSGTANQTLAGPNSYSGDTAINVGGLVIANDSALGDTTGITTVAVTGTTVGSVTPALAAGGRLILSNGVYCSENITLTGSSEQPGGFNASIDSIANTNFLVGEITLAGTGGQRINATGELYIDGPIARDGSNAGILVLRTGSTISTLTVNNTIDLNGAGVNIQGLGTVVLNAANTELASATVAFGGPLLTLKLGITNALPAASDLSIGTSNATAGTDQGIVDLGGFDQTVRALTAIQSAGATPAAPEFRKITNSSGTPSLITAGNTSGAPDVATFNGVIEDGTGGVALTKVGDGTLNLLGANTYTGATTVTAGTLALVGGSQTSVITVGSGAFLGFTLGSPTSSTALVNLTAGAVKITGTPTLPSYTLMTASSITGTPALSPSIPGYALVVDGGNTLKLNAVAVGNTYSDWLTTNAPATGFATDSDNDGVSNGVENVLGTNPNAYSAGLTQVSASTGSATFKHMLNPTIASDVTYGYQWSTNLVEWKASTETNAGGTTATIAPSAPDAGVVTVTTTINSGPSGKLFLRLRANQP